MLDTRRGVVDGVPVFWVDGGTPLLTACLLFRAGQADEPLSRRGYLHLLEHLALHDLKAAPQLEYNGSVGAIFTTFTIRGPATDVTEWLAELTRRLGRPDDEALGHEARVLAQEERVRTGSILDNAFLYRWGARGPGVIWFRQVGLNQVDPDALEAAARRWFVRQNCALALDGPIPESLRLWLPDGERQHALLPPPARALPAAAPDDLSLLTGVVDSGDAAEIALGIAAARLNRSLRGRGAVAGWQADGQRLGPATHLTLIPPDDNAPRTHLAGALTVLRQLADDGPLSGELQEQGRVQEQAQLARQARYPVPVDDAEAFLLQPGENGAQRQKGAAVSAPQVASIAQQWLDSLLVTVPSPAALPEGVPWLFDRDPVRPPSRGAITVGTSRPDAAWPRIHFDGRSVLFRSRAETMTIEVDQLALYGVNPDGQRILVARNGDRLVLDPGEWHRPAAIIAAIDQAAPPAVVVPMEPRPASEVARPPRGGERVGLLVRHGARWLATTATGRNTVLTVLIVVAGILAPILLGGGAETVQSVLLGVPILLLVVWGGTLSRAIRNQHREAPR